MPEHDLQVEREVQRRADHDAARDGLDAGTRRRATRSATIAERQQRLRDLRLDPDEEREQHDADREEPDGRAASPSRSSARLKP